MKKYKKFIYYLLLPFVVTVYCLGRGVYFISQIIRSLAFLLTFNPYSAIEELKEIGSDIRVNLKDIL